MGTTADAPRRAAREAEANPAFRILARAGFAATGLVHILIGVIVIVIAAGGKGEGDQSGALKAVAAAPLGFVALWIIALALWALGVWFAFDGVLSVRHRADAEGLAGKWGRRLTAWGKAAVFLVFGLFAAAVALGARPDSETSANVASRTAFDVPGGPLVLGAVGIAIGAAGVGFAVIGIRRGFRKVMELPRGAVGDIVSGLGVIGYVAKGVALVLVAALVIAAVVTADPRRAGGLDSAVTTALGFPGGAWLVGAVGVGLIAYGLFSLIRVRYARLRPS